MYSRLYGTHNSLTGSKLVWWQRPFGWLINAMCRCQDKTIAEQYLHGCRWFNLQVNLYKGRWIGSHGLAWYDVDLLPVLDWLNQKAKSERNTIYIQLYLDRNFFAKNNEQAFRDLVNAFAFNFPHLTLQRVWLEKSNVVLLDKPIKGEEVYWSATWASQHKWYHYLPFPRLWHSKIKPTGKCLFTMVDFL